MNLEFWTILLMLFMKLYNQQKKINYIITIIIITNTLL